jgi:hypothetical protein
MSQAILKTQVPLKHLRDFEPRRRAISLHPARVRRIITAAEGPSKVCPVPCIEKFQDICFFNNPPADY